MTSALLCLALVTACCLLAAKFSLDLWTREQEEDERGTIRHHEASDSEQTDIGFASTLSHAVDSEQ